MIEARTVDRALAAQIAAELAREDAAQADDYLPTTVCDRLGLARPVCVRASKEIGGAERENLAARWNAEAHRARQPARLPRVGGEFVHLGDRFAFIGDSDDQTPISTPFDAQRAFNHRMAQEAETEFHSHAATETGLGASPEEVCRQRAERDEIRAQSHELAHRLELAGKQAYRDESFRLWTWWVHSQKAESIPSFRRICLLPYVAAIVRAPKLAALEFFLQRNPFARFWTFTSGQRVGISGLRDRIQWLHGRLSELNSKLLKWYGVQMVFRSTELGTVEFDEHLNRVSGAGSVEFDDQGNPLFHVHAHCVVVSRVGFIKPAKWERLIRDVWSFWGYHWDAGKVIGDAREACKYVTKPGDMLKLTPEHLGQLHEALFRLKLCQPMGILADEIRARKGTPEKPGKALRRYRVGAGEMVWREVPDHNAWAKFNEQERAEYRNLTDSHEMAEETAAAARVENSPAESFWVAQDGTTVRDVAGGPGTLGAAVQPREKAVDFCRVFARLSPAIGPSGLKEPRVIVGGTRFDRKRVTSHPLVFRLWSQTVQEWEAGRAISVHTGTPTPPEPEPFDWLREMPERTAPPEAPIFAQN